MWITRDYRNVFAINTDSMCPCFVVTWATHFFTANLPRTSRSHVTRACRKVNRLPFTFLREEVLLEVSYLLQDFLTIFGYFHYSNSRKRLIKVCYLY